MFKIGTVSKLLGISMEGLRLYERKGITHPVRDPQTGYRYYSLLDITALIRSRNYRSLGFTMNQVSELLHEADVQKISRHYRAQAAFLCRERELLDLKISYLQELASLIESLPDSLGRFERVLRPGFFRTEFADDEQICANKEEFFHWMDYLPFASVGPRYLHEVLSGGSTLTIAGLNLPEQYAHFFGVVESASIRYYPPQLCLSAIAVHRRGMSEEEFLVPFRKYAQQHHITAAGPIIANTFLSHDFAQSYARYRQVFIPLLG